MLGCPLNLDVDMDPVHRVKEQLYDRQHVCLTRWAACGNSQLWKEYKNRGSNFVNPPQYSPRLQCSAVSGPQDSAVVIFSYVIDFEFFLV